MIKRLNAALNFICTYEKVVTINKKIVDVIEDFSVEVGKVVLYGYHNTYEFIFSSIDIHVENTHVSINFNGWDEGNKGVICF